MHIPVGGARLYVREVGQGQAIIVLHGGPDFDHRYLLPDMDRLADGHRLIYYDQRGRGQSAGGVSPEDVSMDSEIADLDAVRAHHQLDVVALLGHSWGAVLALEYALRHPERVSHLVLMNPGPASSADRLLLRAERRNATPEDMDQLQALAATPGYQRGDPDAVAAYYRVSFGSTVRRPEDLDRLIGALRASFTRESVMTARAIEGRLLKQTWLSDDYDLLPALGRLDVPTLVIRGDHDFIPAAISEGIARAIPGARLRSLPGGHFSFLDSPDAVRREIDDLLHAR